MYYSKLLIPTLREDPGEAEVISHRLMLRAGMIRKLAAGIYNYLPLGYRVIRKIENIVREEMNRAGAQEIFMPMVLPAELWRETGRWEKYGKELLRLRDRHDRDFCLGPTHEEVVTDIVRNDVKSYRQLPLNLYQIQSKFRDEIRPRFGLMRGREFIMKDAYSFDADQSGAEESYRKMYNAYINIFTRCGLTFKPVEADTGLIGGQFSHEFMVLAETGEEAVVSCNSCDYAANMEKAESRINLPDNSEFVAGSQSSSSGAKTPLPMERRLTPGKKSVEDVSAFLEVKTQQLVKTLIVRGDDRVVAVLLRGDHELNGTKLSRLLGCVDVQLLEPSEVEKTTGSPSGFSGPVGLKGVPVIADTAVQDMSNFIVGGNERDVHLINVNLSRDFKPDQFADVRNAAEGDGCPRCDAGRLFIVRGIEVGHTFKLGTKYSEAMGATYLDVQGNPRPVIMGCYGIGVGRTMAAAIEQNHDKDGIIWPPAIAPFSTIVLPLNVRSEKTYEAALSIYNKLAEKGTDVILDDRDERAGVKFKDADLLGIPWQIVVGDKGVNRGVVEIKNRATKEVRETAIDTILSDKFID
ncbi:MAG: proline--tRNA ligase [Nitrospirae bacterium]|nr:proline--tRNA ligase [Nitrospirota bacterium]